MPAKKKTTKKSTALTKKRALAKKKKEVALVKQERESIAETIMDECGGDESLALFVAEWIRNGQNATAAARTLRPYLTDGSARVVGSRLLTSVNILTIFTALGLGVTEYIESLKDGLNAKQVAVTTDPESGNISACEIDVPDHEVRRGYHDKLGRLLGMETKDGDSPNVAIQVNQNNSNSIEEMSDEELNATYAR